MKLALFGPYGSSSPESQLTFLLASYLKQIGHEVVQLECNGTATACDRDRLTGYRRELLNCARCMCDQQSLASWAGLALAEASRFLTSAQVIECRRFISELFTDQLFEAQYDGVSLIELCRYSLFHRLGGAHPDLNRRDHERMVREHLAIALRTLLISREFIREVNPEVSLILGGQDVLTRSYVATAVASDRTVVLFQQGSESSVVRAVHPGIGRVLNLEIELQDVRVLKNDIGAWPAEVLLSLEETAVNLRLIDPQIPLPIAR